VNFEGTTHLHNQHVMDATSRKLRTLEQVLQSRNDGMRNARTGIAHGQHDAEEEYRELVILQLQTDVGHAQGLLEKIKATGNSIPLDVHHVRLS
jgi:hypothetical protein